MSDAYYKVLDADGRPCHGGQGAWKLPRGKRPGAWRKVSGPVEPCANGLHLCRRDDLVHWLGPAIYRAEARGEVVVADNKVVVAEARLLERLTAWDERTARLFAADCAERALMRERDRSREPDERCWNALVVARLYANGEASEEERDAARAAASARAAAWDAARDAAGAAAWDAERSWQTSRLFAYLECRA